MQDNDGHTASGEGKKQVGSRDVSATENRCHDKGKFSLSMSSIRYIQQKEAAIIFEPKVNVRLHD